MITLWRDSFRSAGRMGFAASPLANVVFAVLVDDVVAVLVACPCVNGMRVCGLAKGDNDCCCSEYDASDDAGCVFPSSRNDI